MLAIMFDGSHVLRLDDAGRVFLDRHVRIFRYVIDYLRTGCDSTWFDRLDHLNLNSYEYESICAEFDYFLIPFGGQSRVCAQHSIKCLFFHVCFFSFFLDGLCDKFDNLYWWLPLIE